MQELPRRLRRSPLARSPYPVGTGASSDGFPFRLGGRRLVRRARAIRRGVLIVLWTIVAVMVQAVCNLLPGHAKITSARLFWTVFCRLLGLRVRVIGEPAGHAGGRPVVFVSNHSSWLDVPVLGGTLDCCFIRRTMCRAGP